jgi:hypothetical protein
MMAELVLPEQIMAIETAVSTGVNFSSWNIGFFRRHQGKHYFRCKQNIVPSGDRKGPQSESSEEFMKNGNNPIHKYAVGWEGAIIFKT